MAELNANSKLFDRGTNRYLDTRGRCEAPLPFSEAIIEGIASGGGLFVPQEIPHYSLSQILELASMPYYQQASFVYKSFGIDFDADAIENLMAKSYGSNFDTPAICPITTLDDDTHVLELWHGPTSAFKDLALQCLPQFFTASAAKLKAEGKIENDFFILVATSGDTGKAALEGFKDLDGVQIGVCYPHNGVSDIQCLQMSTQQGDNVSVWAVEGNFDDCQTNVKKTFTDDAFTERLLDEHRIKLSSANSINWGRLMPQIVYYLSSYSRLVAEGKLEAGAPLDVCVPTGNFGNILAAWYAKAMGAPIERLICASNDNHVLTDFINTGIYDIREREFILTHSPSMDILVSSNLERLLFELTDRDSQCIRNWMNGLNKDRFFQIDEQTHRRMCDTFVGGFATNQECLDTIKEVWEDHHYLIDPHTSVAYRVSQNLRGTNPLLIVSTAHWAKFGASVYKALHGIGTDEPLSPALSELTGNQLIRLVAEETQASPIPPNLDLLDKLPRRFDQVIGGTVADIENAVVEFLA